MSTKRKRNILAIALSTALLLAAVITLCGFAFAAETEEIPASGAVESAPAPAPAREYPYLKGTRYKNLYAAGYSNLFKATIEEPVPEEAMEAGSGFFHRRRREPRLLRHRRELFPQGQDRSRPPHGPGHQHTGPSRLAVLHLHLLLRAQQRCLGGKDREPSQRRALPEHRNLRSQLE